MTPTLLFHNDDTITYKYGFSEYNPVTYTNRQTGVKIHTTSYQCGYVNLSVPEIKLVSPFTGKLKDAFFSCYCDFNNTVVAKVAKGVRFEVLFYNLGKYYRCTEMFGIKAFSREYNLKMNDDFSWEVTAIEEVGTYKDNEVHYYTFIDRHTGKVIKEIEHQYKNGLVGKVFDNTFEELMSNGKSFDVYFDDEQWTRLFRQYQQSPKTGKWLKKPY